MDDQQWEGELAAVWAAIDELGEERFLASIAELAARAPAGPAVGAFERACSLDSTGHSDLAAPLYREAISGGLTGERRRRAVIQMASSLRNLGHAQESATLLRAELDRGEADQLEDAVRGFLALALADCGHEREAASLALGALAAHLPRYQRSLANYAQELLTE